MPKIKVKQNENQPEQSAPVNDMMRKYLYAEQYLITGNRLEAAARIGEDLFEDFQTQAIIKEMRASIVERGHVTLEGHLEELALIRDFAKKDGKWAVALNAEVARGKVHGLYIERSSVNISDLSNASSADLRNQMEELARLIDREQRAIGQLTDRRIIDVPIETDNDRENTTTESEFITEEELLESIRGSDGDSSSEETRSSGETEETSRGDAI